VPAFGWAGRELVEPSAESIAVTRNEVNS
jgi:hypothetical protein